MASGETGATTGRQKKREVGAEIKLYRLDKDRGPMTPLHLTVYLQTRPAARNMLHDGNLFRDQ